MAATDPPVLDALIIGAGISGINTAYRFQTQLPDLKYLILESRAAIGGTWDFFRYPGLRSDSDLYTFGFSWRPWTRNEQFAQGSDILQYLAETVKENGIDTKIRFGWRAVHFVWRDEEQLWRVECQRSLNVEKKDLRDMKSELEHKEEVEEVEEKIFYCRFLVIGSGYYDYKTPFQTVIPGLENFGGTVVHTQFWPEGLDYSGKKMVIIGSGATAVTILPVLAQKASHVTMLQRTPSFIKAMPSKANSPWMIKWVPTAILARFNRIRFLLLGYFFMRFCQIFPVYARNLIIGETKARLPEGYKIDPHFIPPYNPWEQRLCMAPGGDFHKAIRSRKADVATGRIQTVTKDGILLESGEEISADIIITATGIKMQLAGGASFTVNNKPLAIGDRYMWRGAMLHDIPNTVFMMGYPNNSWTLGADASATLFCRIIREVRRRGATSVRPVLTPEEMSQMEVGPAIYLDSTYIKTAIAAGVLPKSGNKAPWLPRDSYWRDWLSARWGSITTGLRYDTFST